MRRVWSETASSVAKLLLCQISVVHFLTLCATHATFISLERPNSNANSSLKSLTKREDRAGGGRIEDAKVFHWELEWSTSEGKLRLNSKEIRDSRLRYFGDEQRRDS